MARRAGNLTAHATAQCHLAQLKRQRGELDEAERVLAAGIRTLQALGTKPQLAELVTRALHVSAGIGVVIGIIVLLRPRWFCRWVCPMGACADEVCRLGRRLGRRPARFLPLGQWIFWLTLGGALLFPWPFLLWLDPLAIFSSAFTPLAARSTPATWLALVPALAVLLLSLIWPYIWCSKICPLGAFQDILSHCRKRIV